MGRFTHRAECMVGCRDGPRASRRSSAGAGRRWGWPAGRTRCRIWPASADTHYWVLCHKLLRESNSVRTEFDSDIYRLSRQNNYQQNFTSCLLLSCLHHWPLRFVSGDNLCTSVRPRLRQLVDKCPKSRQQLIKLTKTIMNTMFTRGHLKNVSEGCLHV